MSTTQSKKQSENKMPKKITKAIDALTVSKSKLIVPTPIGYPASDSDSGSQELRSTSTLSDEEPPTAEDLTFLDDDEYTGKHPPIVYKMDKSEKDKVQKLVAKLVKENTKIDRKDPKKTIVCNYWLWDIKKICEIAACYGYRHDGLKSVKHGDMEHISDNIPKTPENLSPLEISRVRSFVDLRLLEMEQLSSDESSDSDSVPQGRLL